MLNLQTSLGKRLKALLYDTAVFLSLHFLLFILVFLLEQAFSSPAQQAWVRIYGGALVFSPYSVPLVLFTLFEWRYKTSFGKFNAGLKYGPLASFALVRLGLRNLLKVLALTAMAQTLFRGSEVLSPLQFIGIALLGADLLLVLNGHKSVHDWATGCELIPIESSEEPPKYGPDFAAMVTVWKAPALLFAVFFLLLVGSRGYRSAKRETQLEAQVQANAFILQTLVETYSVDEQVYPKNLKELYAHAHTGKPYWQEMKNPFSKQKHSGIGSSIAMAGEEIQPGIVTYQALGNPPLAYVIYAYDKQGQRKQYKGQDFFLSNS